MFGQATDRTRGLDLSLGVHETRAVYRILPLADDFVEVCDECGFDGALIDMGDAAAALRGLGDSWASVFSHSEALLRARPAPATWCPVEYTQHTTFALGAIEWAAGQFVDGRSPDWTQEPRDLTGEFEHDLHNCDRFEIASTLDNLNSAARSMAAFAVNLTTAEQDRRADYGGGLVINTAAVVRHALHDAEHHLLDIRRGIARLQLSST
jgi:hypothetical protein